MAHGCIISNLYYVKVTSSDLKSLNVQIQDGSPTFQLAKMYYQDLNSVRDPYQQIVIS